ncbi:MAG: hypothetical protein V7607_3460 [Solirubrobacteraceae bacterium]
MDLVVSWVAFPAVAVAVAGGLGLLVRRLAGDCVPALLVVPLGVASIMVVSQLTTTFSFTAELTIPVLLILAAAGWALGWRTVRVTRELAVAGAVFVAVLASYGAPVILSGQATLTGYAVLGDTAIHLIGADALLTHGHDFGSLPPSSYSATLHAYYDSSGYPSGGPTALGALTRLVGADSAWTLNAFLALLGASLAVTMLALLRRFGAGRVAAPIGAVAAAQPALVYAYAQMGSIKEMGAAAMIPLAVACAVAWSDERERGWRTVLPLAVATAAAASAIGLVVAAWIAPILLVVVTVAAWRGREARHLVARHTAVFVGLLVVLALQTVVSAKGYLDATTGVLTSQTEGGNLLAPLDRWQAVGVWLEGDFRRHPVSNLSGLSNALMYLVVVAGVIGVAYAVRRRAWQVPLYVGWSAIALAVLLWRGSPWADGKALMVTSPAFVFAAALGAAALVRNARIGPSLVSSARLVMGSALLAVVVFGVMFSNALAYHNASLAPRDRFDELRTIASRIGDRGPTLLPDWDENAKHFLREAAPEAANEPFGGSPIQQGARSTDLLGSAGDATVVRQPGRSVDLDLYGEPYLKSFTTIVMRDRASVSRPPSIFHRTYHGAWYDVWERNDVAARRMVAHLPVGQPGEPGAEPSCRLVHRLAGLTGPAGSLVFAEASPVVRVNVVPGPHPGNWPPAPQDPNELYPYGPGSLTRTFRVARDGRYALWLQASVGRTVEVLVDGRRVGSVGDRLNFQGAEEPVATLPLSAGRHAITLASGGGDLKPGNGNESPNRLVGPVRVSVPDPMTEPIRTIPRSRWRELCGRNVDWVDGWRRG